MKLSDYVIQFLEEKDIEHLFFVPGGGCMHLVDSLAQSKKIQNVNLLHEQSAAIAAESYAFTKQSTGVALFTTGPGGTNAITGVLSAYVDSIPCFFLSGQVKTSDLKANFGVRSHGSQEADIVSIVKSITKYAVMVQDKNDIRYCLEKAWYEAHCGRKGPVWVDIPLDIQGSDIQPETLRGFVANSPRQPSFSQEAATAFSLITKAKRPIILAGNGLRGAEEEFSAFLAELGIPVIPTWKACDLVPNAHPLYAGKSGTLGERSANFAMQKADLLLCLGCKLDFSVTGFDRSKWAVDAKKIVVDIDEAEINKLQIPLELAVVGDVKVFIQAFLGQLSVSQTKVPSFDGWKAQIRDLRAKYPLNPKPENANGKVPKDEISTYELVASICKNAPLETVVVPASAGTVAEICYQALCVKEGQAVRSNHGLGSMGYELPAAIGAYFALGKEVVTIAGDGGLQLNVQELAVIAGRGLPIKIFVVNNAGYSSIRNMQRNHFEGRYCASNADTGLFLPNMAALAKAYGIESNEVFLPEKLEDTVQAAFAKNGPFVCDVHVDPFCIVSPRSQSKVLENGNLQSSALEDLFPFLSKEELDEAMRIKD